MHVLDHRVDGEKLRPLRRRENRAIIAGPKDGSPRHAKALDQPLDQLELAGRFGFRRHRNQEARGLISFFADGTSAISLIVSSVGRVTLTRPPAFSASARAT